MSIPEDSKTGSVARTWLVSVLFLDIVGYSKQAVEIQLSQKDLLNRAITLALAGVVADDRVILDTGDGAAICFLSDPEVALRAGLTVHRALYEASRDPQSIVTVRMGINLGPVKLVRDLNGQLNAVGDGINVGQRIMSFAEDGQIAASRSFVEVVACLSAEHERRFQLLGPKKDKHSREHIVYIVKCDTEACATPRVAEEGLQELPAEFAEKVRKELTLSLGPIASVLTRRFAKRTKNAGDFIDLCRAEIEDPTEQERFKLAASKLLAATQATSGSVACVGSVVAAPYCPFALDGTTLGDIERSLCSYLGPVGRILVKKTVPTVSNAPQLYEALAAHIPDDHDRRLFLAECTGMSDGLHPER